ncbi:hypothetical protein, partial [Halobium salinum]
MALFPTKFLTTMQNLAVENPDDFVDRRWVVPYVRAEGLVVAVVCLRGGSAYRAFMAFIGAVGAVLLLFPRQYVEFGNRLAYEGSAPFEWRKRYLPGLRVCGAFFLLLAARALRTDDRDE